MHHFNTAKPALLALLLALGCDEEGGSTSSEPVSVGTEAVTTSEAGDSSSTGDGSSSTSGESTGGEGSGSTDIPDMGEPITPDEQPGWGEEWGPCTNDAECPLGNYCARIPPNPLADRGICTNTCSGADGCWKAPVCAAQVVCGKLWDGGPPYCMLACDPAKDSTDCPIGAVCREAVNAEPDSPAQWVCL